MHFHTSIPSLYGKEVGELVCSTPVRPARPILYLALPHPLVIQINIICACKPKYIVPLRTTPLLVFSPHPVTGQANHFFSLQSSGFCLDYSTALQPLQPSSCPYALCLRLCKRAVSLENVLDLGEVCHKVTGMD